MKIVNFSHPLTPPQIQAIEEATGQNDVRLIERNRHFDVARPYVDQARELVEEVGLSPREWQTPPLLVNLPALSVIAGLVLAEVHGRSGHFPAILRLKPVAGALVTTYEFAEILNLEALRQKAREETCAALANSG